MCCFLGAPAQGFSMLSAFHAYYMMFMKTIYNPVAKLQSLYLWHLVWLLDVNPSLKRDVTIMTGQRSTVNVLSWPGCWKGRGKLTVQADAGCSLWAGGRKELGEKLCLLILHPALLFFFCFRLCMGWAMPQHWSCVERHASYAQIMSSIKPQGYRMHFLGLMIWLS